MQSLKKVFVILVAILLFFPSLPTLPVNGQTSGFVEVSAGNQHTLALDSEGNVWSWGINQFGQVGDGTANVRPYRVKVQGITDVKTTVAGAMNSVAVKNDGTVWVWGLIDSSDFGENRTTVSYLPVQVQGLSDVKSVSAGGGHTLALKEDGTVWSWGSNSSGQLGIGNTEHTSTPTQVLGLDHVIQLSTGGFHSLALKDNGTVWSWGTNSPGMLGIGNTINSDVPVQVPGLTGIVSISAGWYFSTALQSDGTVWTWGENICGQLGDGTTENRLSPVQVPGLTGIKQIAAGIRHTLALDANGTVWVWGNDWTKHSTTNTFLGYELILNPVPVPGLKNIKEVSSGGAYYIVLTEDGKILSWGNNYNGELGDGSGEGRSNPGDVVDSLIPNDIRLAGAGRIETAISVSKKMLPIPHSADAVLLATSENFPDALVGASLGGIKNAPLLLVAPSGDNQKTITEISRVLKPQGTIYILGGTGVVSKTFENQLKSVPNDFVVKRLAGDTRYATAAEIAKVVKPQTGGEVIIATGENFPDSLAISPYLAMFGIPMVLVEANEIPDESLAYLNQLQPAQITIVGGEGVVSPMVEGKLRDMFPNASLRRYGGLNRYDTAAKIAQALFGDTGPNLFVAKGTDFPDALAGSIFAGSTLSPIVLVEPDKIPKEIESDYLDTLSDKKVVTLGGQGAVSDNVLENLKSLIK